MTNKAGYQMTYLEKTFTNCSLSYLASPCCVLVLGGLWLAIPSTERKACCCAVALAGWRFCNSTTISVQGQCSTLAGVGHFGHRFFAFWLSGDS